MSEVSVKRGDTLMLQLTFQNDDRSGVDLTDVSLSSQVRNPAGELVATLTASKTSVVNIATVQADTSQWPHGIIRCDIRAISNGITELSETFGIRVNRAVTQ